MVTPSTKAGPFGDVSAVSPETAVDFKVSVQCDYKWTLQLYEARDFDASQAQDKSKAPYARFERGIYSFTASADRSACRFRRRFIAVRPQDSVPLCLCAGPADCSPGFCA